MPDDHAASSLASFRPAFTCLRSNSLTLSPRAALRPLPPPLAQLLLLCSMPFLAPALPPLPPFRSTVQYSLTASPPPPCAVARPCTVES